MAPLPKKDYLNYKNKQIITKALGDSSEHLFLSFLTANNITIYFYIIILNTQLIQTKSISHSKLGNSYLLQHVILASFVSPVIFVLMKVWNEKPWIVLK